MVTQDSTFKYHSSASHADASAFRKRQQERLHRAQPVTPRPTAPVALFGKRVVPKEAA